jgi:hypothetical protein
MHNQTQGSATIAALLPFNIAKLPELVKRSQSNLRLFTEHRDALLSVKRRGR